MTMNIEVLVTTIIVPVTTMSIVIIIMPIIAIMTGQYIQHLIISVHRPTTLMT